MVQNSHDKDTPGRVPRSSLDLNTLYITPACNNIRKYKKSPTSSPSDEQKHRTIGDASDGQEIQLNPLAHSPPAGPRKNTALQSQSRWARTWGRSSP